jgi:hypothetical protein
VALPPVFATLMLLLLVALSCQVDSSVLLDARMWRLFVVVLDAASSRLRSRGAASGVRANLLVCGPCLLFLLFSYSFFSFVLKLGAL